MRAFILLALVAFTVAQWQNIGNIFRFGDRIHGYSFEYHRHEDLLLVHNSSACFIVDVDKDIATKLAHKDTKEALEDAIYAQIKKNTGETVTDLAAIKQSYHDNRANFECFKHAIYTLKVVT